MATKITRATQKLFGTSGGANTFTEFGALAASYPAVPVQYTGGTITVALVQALATFAVGWTGAIVSGNAPAFQDMNSLFYCVFYQLCYGLQTGVQEWDSATNYFIGSLTNDGTGGLYKSLTNSNLNNAVTATVYTFTVTSANATVGATYTTTNNGLTITFTVSATIASQVTLVCTATSAPPASGTLTKTGGSGDATITFSAYTAVNNWQRSGGGNTQTKSAAYAVLFTDGLIRMSGTSTAYLPDATLCSGSVFTLKNVDTGGNTVTLGVQVSGQTIDQGSTFPLATQYQFVRVQSNGTNYDVIGW
jgi:hypothetical protein